MVYLLRFSKPIGGPKHYAQYYIGWTSRDDRLWWRLSQHRRCVGASITAAAVRAGAELEVVRTWPGGDRQLERQLKRRKCHRRLLPAR